LKRKTVIEKHSFSVENKTTTKTETGTIYYHFIH